MNNLPRKALVLLMFISVSGPVLADNASQARVWLERMTKAMNGMSYQGTFVYVRDGVVETMRITHVSDETGVRERMYSTSGPRREVIRDRLGVRCIWQDSNSVVKDTAVANTFFPELPLAAIDNKSAGYHLKLNGKARIAGQVARRVSVRPRDAFRYGYDYWLEEKTGLLLKWVLTDTDQKVLAKLMFTDIAIGTDIDLEELGPDSAADNYIELPTFNRVKTVVTQSSPRWKPRRLPPGFKLSSHNQQMSPDGIFEHMVYSDGLAAVSVYIENKGSAVGVLQGVSQLGTNNAYSRQQGELQITAIGEVPAVTVKTIANSMARTVASN